jgi:hypothetical protein
MQERLFWCWNRIILHKTPELLSLVLHPLTVKSAKNPAFQLKPRSHPSKEKKYSITLVLALVFLTLLKRM